MNHSILLISFICFGSANAQKADSSNVVYVAAESLDSIIRHNPDVRPNITFVDFIDSTNYSASVIKRTATGKSEIHQNERDIWYVIKGSGILVTGGKVVGGKQTEPHEIRGDSIINGTERHIGKGDFITVPTGIPHWVKKVDEEIIYLVVKVKSN